MHRMVYFDYIEKQLNFLALRLSVRSKINLLELNIHSETFFADFCNILFDLELNSLNAHTQNIEGIDLIDRKNKIIAQVTSVGTRANKVADFIKNNNLQLVVSMLKDKLPTELNDKSNVVLELSQQDKLFKMPN